jgi:hypothetical protein
MELNNGHQAGTGGKHSLLGVLVAPTRIEFGNPSRVCRVNLNCENLRNLLDTKGASRNREALEDPMRVFPFLLIDDPQCAFVCLV